MGADKMPEMREAVTVSLSEVSNLSEIAWATSLSQRGYKEEIKEIVERLIKEANRVLELLQKIEKEEKDASY